MSQTDELKAALPARPGKRGGMLEVEIPASEYEKLLAFWDSGTFEKSSAARDARLDGCLKSAEIALNWATRHNCSGARIFATLLASLYNGNRVKLDVSDLRGLDAENFEHAINVIRLSFETHSEPHTWFQNGGRIFEKMIDDWRLEKKRRARS